MDLFGAFDLLCVGSVLGFVGIQVCTMKMVAEHRRTVENADVIPFWISWGKVYVIAPEKKGNRWTFNIWDMQKDGSWNRWSM